VLARGSLKQSFFEALFFVFLLVLWYIFSIVIYYLKNMHCSKCGQKTSKDVKICSICGYKIQLIAEDKEEEVFNTNNENTDRMEFIIIPTVRLVIFSILSFGFYSVYWFVINFNAIKNSRQTRNKETNPILWGLFNTLTSVILFKELNIIKKEATGQEFKISPEILGAAYFALMILGTLIFISPLVFIFTAVIFQKKVKEYSKYKISSYKVRQLNWTEVIIVAVAFVVFIVSYNAANYYNNLRHEIMSDSNFAQKIVMEAIESNIKAQNSVLPRTSGGIRLDAIYILDNEINYKYTLVSASKDDLGPEWIKIQEEEIKDFFCYSANTKVYRDNNINRRDVYYDKDDVLIGEIFIDVSRDCRHQSVL
jgi:hypothetical protein